MTTQCPKCKAENFDDSKFCKECGTQLIPLSVTKTLKVSSALSPGKTIAGKYKILKEIGRGGMGVVYKAEDLKLKRCVAIKFLPPELTRDTEAKERFIREAQAAAALSHPNICTIHEIDEDEDKSFIVMEYVEGQSLREKLKAGALKLDEALDIATQVSQGLERAHTKGIVHRDIKSANIMLTEAGEAKVMDFGLAKVTGSSLITKEATTMGTVAYMSPEQASGEPVESRTDIWSLGVVMYEMFTGQLPFVGDTDRSVMYAIERKIPVPMKKIMPNVKTEIERVVEKALEKKPADRYQTMGELLEDLRALAEGMRPIRAKSRLFKGRILGIKRAYFYAGLTALAILVAAVMFLFLPRQGEVLDSIAILPLINDSGDPTQDYFANSLTTLLISELYKVAALKVAPREAVMPFKNSTKSLKEKAEELNVKALVEASVLRSGDRIRLTASLIDPYQNKIIWSETMEKDYSEILILQSELSQAVVNGIKVAITPDEKMQLVADRKVNPEAYDLILQGIEHVHDTRDYVQGYKNAKECFQKAVDIDPTSALAQSWLSTAYWWLGGQRVIPEKEAFLKAKETASRAIELDANLGVAHVNLGDLQLTEWDFIGAEREYRRAIELEPGNSESKVAYSDLLMFCRRYDEAITIVKQLMDQPGNIDLSAKLIQYYILAGYFDEALEEARKRMNSGPYSPWIHMQLTWALTNKKMYAEALSEWEKIWKKEPSMKENYIFLLQNAYTLARVGQRDKALQKLEEIKVLLAKENIMDSSYESANIFAVLGDRDTAFQFLNQAYENHNPRMIWLNVDDCFLDLRGDSRFEDLLKKVGFPEVQLPSEGR